MGRDGPVVNRAVENFFIFSGHPTHMYDTDSESSWSADFKNICLVDVRPTGQKLGFSRFMILGKWLSQSSRTLKKRENREKRMSDNENDQSSEYKDNQYGKRVKKCQFEDKVVN